jgi:hypothetical protein
MTQLQAAILSSRLICAWLIYNAAMGLFALFRNAVTVFSGVFSMMGGVQNSRFMNQNIGNSAIFLFEIVLNLLLAVLFYRCGPKVLKFLIGPQEEASIEAESDSAGIAQG